MRLGCLRWKSTGRKRFVGASYGPPPPVNRRVEEARGTSRPEARTRLAHQMPAKESTRTQEATLTGGLCLGGSEPVSHSLLWEHVAQARAQAPWQARRVQALSGLTCTGMPSPRAAAPGLLASGAPHLGAPHAPDLCQGQQARRTALAAPSAAQPRAAEKAVVQAAVTRQGVHAPRSRAHNEPRTPGPGRPPKGAARLEPVAPAVAAARHEPQRLPAQRAQVPQSLRAIGPADPVVARERGVRRQGKRMAGDRPQHIDPIRPMAHQAPLSATGLERLEHAERVGPTRQTTSACVSGYGRQHVRPREWASTASYALHAHLIPSYALERGASTRTVTAGEPRRALAERLRPPLFEPKGATPAQGPSQHTRGGLPALECACGRAQRVSLIEEPLTARPGPSQKAGLSDGAASLFPHTA